MSQSQQLSQSTEAHAQSHHIISVRTYMIIYVALMLFLAATVMASEMPFSRSGHLLVAMTIALIKAVLIVLFFMHVYYSAPLTWVVSVGSLLWVGLFLAFLLGDYAGRDWLNIPGK